MIRLWFFVLFVVWTLGSFAALAQQPDRDNDGIPDQTDLDKDNDGISDANEGAFPLQTRSWEELVVGQYRSTMRDGITATISFTTSGNAALGIPENINDTFADQAFWSQPLGLDTALTLAMVWDTEPEPELVDIDLPTDDKGQGTLTITFSQPVLDPVLHLDKLGSIGTDGVVFGSSSVAFTLTNADLSLTRLTGTDDFEVINNRTIQRTPKVLMTFLDNEAQQGVSEGNAAGSVLIEGIVTTLTFSWTGVGIEAAGFDLLEFILTGSTFVDTDGDLVADHLDLDSDNDGIFDLVEAGHGALDANNDGRVDGDVGNNGLLNSLATTDSPTATNNYTLADTDTNGIPNFRDLDADGDGCNDVNEAGFVDSNNNGRLGGLPVVVNTDGRVIGTTDGYTNPGTAYLDPLLNTVSALATNDGPACAGFAINLTGSASGTLTNVTYSWSGPNGFTSNQISPVLTGLTVAASGTYTLTVNANGCTASATTAVAVNPGPPPLNLGPDQTPCPGALIQLRAGAGYDSYLWNTGATGNSIFVNTSGTYTVVVTANGCGTLTDTVRVSYRDLSLDLGPDTVIRFGETLTLNASNPNFDSYLWNTGSTAPSISVTQAGNYTVTATSSACGNVTDQINVGIREAQIQVSGNGFIIENGETIAIPDDNTFIGEVCVDDQTISTFFLIENTGEDTLVVSSLEILGRDSADFRLVSPLGAFRVVPGGGRTISVAFNASASGIREARLSIANNTQTNSPYVFALEGEGAEPITDFLPDTSVICADEAGSIAAFDPLLFGPPTLGYVYLWSRPETGAVDTLDNSLFPLLGTPAPDTSTYSLLVYEPTLGCVVGQDTTTIVRATNPRIRLISPTPEICAGERGTLRIVIRDGLFPMQVRYEFRPATGSPVEVRVNNIQSANDSILARNVRPGSYRLLSATNDVGCAAFLDDEIITISELPLPNLTASISDDRFCLGETTTLTANGAEAYQFYVNGLVQGNFSFRNNFTPNVNLWRAGQNTLRVIGRSTETCPTDTIDFEITLDTIPLVSLGDPVQFFCTGDTFLLDTRYQNSDQFAYFWALAERPTQNIGLGLDTFRITQPGRYLAQVENLTTGCIGTSNIVDVRFSPVTNLDLGADRVVCDRSQTPVRLDARDLSMERVGFQWYDLSRGRTLGRSDTLMVDTVGFYAVVVFDSATQCRNSDTIRVSFVPDPEFTLVGHDPLRGACQERDTLYIQRTNLRNMQITWSGPGLVRTFANDSAAIVNRSGIYTARVTDLSNPQRCTQTQSIAVTLHPAVILTQQDTIRSCENAPIRLDASHPSHNSRFTYRWTNLQNNTFAAADPVWTLNYTDVQTYAPRDFSVAVTSTAGCSARDTITIQFERGSDVRLLAYPQNLCVGDTLRLTADNATDIVWSTGATTASIDVPLDTAGLYAIFVQGAFPTSCASSRDTAFVRVRPLPELRLPEDTLRLCETDSLRLNAVSITHDSTATYLWRNIETEAVVSESGFFVLDFSQVNSYEAIRYEARVTDGCTARDTVVIRFDRGATLTIAQGDSVGICLGDSLRLNSANVQSVLWQQDQTPLGNGAEILLRPQSPGIFTISARNTTGNRCPGSRANTILYVYDLPRVRLQSDALTVCGGISVTLTASGASRYQWSHDPEPDSARVVVAPLTSTTYEVRGITTEGCANTDSLRLTVRDFVGIAGQKNLQACQGDVFALRVDNPNNTPAQYLWLPTGESGKEITANRSGVFRLQVQTLECTFRDSVDVRLEALPRFSLPSDTFLCFDSAALVPLTARLRDPKTNWVYRWTTADTVVLSADSLLEVDAAGDYRFTVTALYPQKNCVTEQNVRVAARCASKLFVPHVFSPNGDGINDYFRVFGQNINNFSIRIYNRWGAVVFALDAESLSQLREEQFWDGGNLPDGLYTWEIAYTDPTIPEKFVKQIGQLTLLR
ncbi:MAG: gliding motility-associated C-terminal domain-containing protein [Bernardetiaceae bacterium]